MKYLIKTNPVGREVFEADGFTVGDGYLVFYDLVYSAAKQAREVVNTRAFARGQWWEVQPYKED